MIHGFRGDHHGLMAIAASLDDFNVLIPDLPGYGKSVELTSEHSVSNYAAWLIEFSSQVTSEFGDYHLIAHSFGTQVVSAALQLGLEVKSVTLLNPISELGTASKSTAKRITSLVYSLSAKLGAVGSALARSWLAVQLMSYSLALTKDRSLRREIHRQHHRFFSNYRSDRVVTEGFFSAARVAVEGSNLPVGSLIIAGEKDVVAPLAAQYLLAKSAAGVKLVVIPEAGHLVHYEHPTVVASLVREQILSSIGVEK